MVAPDPVSPTVGLVRARAGAATASAMLCVAPAPEVTMLCEMPEPFALAQLSVVYHVALTGLAWRRPLPSA